MKATATKELYAYWNRLRGDRAAPERGDVDPVEIRGILGDTFILETEPGHAFPFRLAGSRVCALTGQEMKEEPFLGLWSAPDQETLADTLASVCDDAAVAVLGAQGVTDLNRRVDLEIALLPMRHRGRTHARVLGSLSPIETPYWLGACAVTRFELTSLRMMWPSGRRRPLADAAGLEAAPLGAVAQLGRRIGRFMVFDGGR